MGPGCENLGSGVRNGAELQGSGGRAGVRGLEAAGLELVSRVPELRAISLMNYSPRAPGALALRKA